ncbi:MAG: ferredoxin [Bryobacteraceae bacterium]|nr:ferredoxin [Bryobacteraceae bacterium]MDW8376668.1 ferredoxin [Bryobacterales bacterium]
MTGATAESSHPAGGGPNAAAKSFQESLRTFHISGRGLNEYAPAESAVPAILSALETAGLLESDFPLYLPPEGAPQRLADALAASLPNPATFPLLAPRLQQIAKVFEDVVAPGGSPMAFAKEKALSCLPDRLSFTPAEWGQFDKEIVRFAKLSPASGLVLPCQAAALPVLYGAILVTARRPARERFLHEVKKTAGRLRNLLSADEAHRKGSGPSEGPGDSFGAAGDRFLESERLAEAFARPVLGSRLLDCERRSRMLSALETLERWLSEMADAPQFWLFSSAAEGEDVSAVGGRRQIYSDPLAAARRACQRGLDVFGEVLIALRVARLECEGVFDPALHGPALERLSWRSASSEQLAAVPAVVVMESRQRAAGASLADLSLALRSGLPLHVLVVCPGVAPEDGGKVAPADLGFVALAHRGAFVLQSSMTRRGHLLDGLREMASRFQAAVAVVAVPPSKPFRRAWLESEFLVLSRSHPLFCYDPERGRSWAECLTLEEREVDAISFELGGGRETMTPAHALAMASPAHLRLIPEDYQDTEIIPLDEYFARWENQPPLAIPYLWLQGKSGKPQRAVLSRDAISYCRERMQAWRMLQELAGVHNRYVEQAVAETRAEMAAETERREQAAAERARREAQQQTVQRLVAALMDTKGLSRRPALAVSQPSLMPPEGSVQPATPVLPARRVPGSPSTPSAAAAPLAPPAPALSAQPSHPPDGVQLGEDRATQKALSAVSATSDLPPDPYIDSFLCTSCNDCIKINPRMFQYNADKQAYLADPAAGTYAELVKAAEGCPAKCIHPGLPRPGDQTATPDLIAKAAKFR